MNWIDVKYLNLLSSRLKNFKRKSSNLYNCSCPICGDSKSKKSRARGYFFEKKGVLLYYCHNCGPPAMRFDKFLYQLDQLLYNDYRYEKLKDEQNTIPLEVVEPRKVYKNDIFNDCQKVSQLKHDHFAKKFVMARKIPSNLHHKLYYIPKYNSFVNNLYPDKLPAKYDSARLVIPFYAANGDLIAFLGRTLTDDKLRYSLIIVNDNYPKVYGLDTVDFNKKFYVVEGPLDSMFLENCIAAGGSDLLSVLRKLNVAFDQAVIVFDNEPRNKEICKKINGAIKNGMNVCIWPDMPGKDINEMVLNGFTSSEIQAIIDKHTYQGLTAELEFTKWKKI